ncbi:hypothetical protein OXX59_010426, partial [Metschnikowia pulcherrima]
PESTPIVTKNDDSKTSDTSKPEVPPKETATANIGVREPSSLAPPSGLSPKRRTSSSATSSAASPRRSTNAKVDNTAIFKKTFEAILQSKESQKK